MTTAAVLLRAEIDAVLADWAYHLDHGQLDELAALFTEDALFVTGAPHMPLTTTLYVPASVAATPFKVSMLLVWLLNGLAPLYH